MVKEFFTKNMVCERCIRVLQEELMAAGIRIKGLELGHFSIITEDPEKDLELVNEAVNLGGFSLLQEPGEVLSEQVKLALIRLTESLPLQTNKKLSVFLSEKFGMGYSRISRTFSAIEQLTIEKYFIRLKIEKVKELIQDSSYNFTEIAQLLDYSSINHLSRQFRNETGMSLSSYKEMNCNTRRPLDKII